MVKKIKAPVASALGMVADMNLAYSVKERDNAQAPVARAVDMVSDMVVGTVVGTVVEDSKKTIKTPVDGSSVAGFVAESVEKINALILSFKDHVAEIGGIEAKNTAADLASRLMSYSYTYEQEAKINPKLAAEQFIENATTAINDAKPVLERDLGWGDYLTNLAKQFVNVLTTILAAIVHSGATTHQGFFTLQRSESVQAAEKLEQDITEMPVYGGR